MNNTKAYTPTRPVPDSIAVVDYCTVQGSMVAKKEKLNTSFIFVDLPYDLTGKFNN